MKATLLEWGSSIGIRLPKDLKKKGFKVGDEFEVNIDNLNAITLKKSRSTPYIIDEFENVRSVFDVINEIRPKLTAEFKDKNSNIVRSYFTQVYAQYESNYYYAIHTIDAGYDVSDSVRKTNEKIADKCKTYAELLNLSCGEAVATYVIGNGIRSYNYSDMFLEIAAEIVAKWIDDYGHKWRLVSACGVGEHETLSDILFCEDCQECTGREASTIQAEFLCDFNGLGSELSWLIKEQDFFVEMEEIKDFYQL